MSSAQNSIWTTQIEDSRIHIKSFAKINLGLKILGQRPDGYHDILTVFQVIDLHDTIEIRRTSGARQFHTNHVQLTHLPENLCTAAIDIVEEACQRKISVGIRLTKNIPLGAGLGGGSSNAASVLVGVNHLFELNLTQKTLFELAGRLGADVPFFVGFLLGQGAAAIGEGRGEVLEYIKLNSPDQLVLGLPEVEVSTAWAYQNFKKYKSLRPLRISRMDLTNKLKSVKFSPPFEEGKFFENDLEPIVFSEFTRVKSLKDELIENGAFFASMSGSGSTVYGFFEGAVDMNEMGKELLNCKVITAKFV